MKGIDYSWSRPPAGIVKAAGFSFVCRYLSHDPSKNLSKAEAAALLKAGLEIVTVWEGGGQDMLRGHAGGVADATAASAQLTAIGMPGGFVYFACDFDASPGQQAPINAYLDGAGSVLGAPRTGIYGGYWPCSRALDGGHAAKAWQTMAWSGGNWDTRAVIRQGVAITVAGESVDLDDSSGTDFGQWPRPAAPPPGPVQYKADGTQSLAGFCAAHGISVDRAIWLMATDRPRGFGTLQSAYIVAGDWAALMPKGMVTWAP